MATSVGVVGAGLGGLVQARMLHLRGVPVTVYEAEPSAQFRTQGGQLDIHEHNGQRALAVAGLTEQFHTIIHEGAESMKILAPDGSVLLQEPDSDGRRPEVLRGDLRRILLDSLPERTVRWGRRVTGARDVGAGRHELRFDDETVATTDLLVGADGTWSKVRPLLSDAVPAYSGTTYVETYLHDADERHPAAAAAVGTATMSALVPGLGISAHREAGGVLHAYTMLRRPEECFAGLSGDELTSKVAAELDGWAPELLALVTESDTAPVVRAIHQLPADHRWDHRPGVTLIGDAAHVMPPSGEGANLAMHDGALLAEAIAEHVADPDRLDAAVAAFEEEMFTRSRDEAHVAEVIQDLCLGDRAPHGLVEFLSR